MKEHCCPKGLCDFVLFFRSFLESYFDPCCFLSFPLVPHVYVVTGLLNECGNLLRIIIESANTKNQLYINQITINYVNPVFGHHDCTSSHQ
jgi:hypothetical protein